MPAMAPSEHITVLLHEAVEALVTTPQGLYVDATFGRGGHSRAILERLKSPGLLVAIDRDPEAVQSARESADLADDPRFSIEHASFANLPAVLAGRGIEKVHGVLLDLGVSSPQIDDPARGFSFRADGPLDMRMDPDAGPSAAEWLATAEEKTITEVLRDYGEERFAKQIAAAIVAARRSEPLRRTGQLAQLVGQAVRTREPGQDPATRTFQALRIHLNRELEEVSVSLPRATARLEAGGRLAVISFHSLEDRIVKRFMQAAAKPVVPREVPLTEREMPKGALRLVGRAIRASDAEVIANPRARSATLRVAERTEAPFDPSIRIEPDARWRS